MEINTIKVYPEFRYLNEIEDGIIISTEDGNAIYANTVASKLLDIAVEDIIGSKWCPPSLNDQNDICHLYHNIETIHVNGGDSAVSNTVQYLIAQHNDKELWTKWSNTKISEGLIMYTIKDISEKQQLAERVETLQRHNTILGQEVQHRVKNNMQIVISLLNLQFSNVRDNKAVKALAKSKDRMIAMTCIQDYISQSEYLSEQSFGEYLNKLVRFIERGHKKDRTIELKVEFAGQISNNNHLVSLGLIICELVVNAYKHAFKFRQGGKVTVSLECTDHKKVILNVHDNGCGFASPLDLENPTTLGYEIIILLVHQIGGSISLTSKDGSNIRVIYYQ